MADAISIKFTAKDQFTRVSDKINRSLQRNQKSVRQFDRTLQRSARNTKRSTDRMAMSIKKVGKATAGLALGAGAVAGAKGAVSRQLRLEQQVMRLLGNIDVKDRAAMEPILRQKILQGERASGRDLEEIADGLFQYTSIMGTSQKTLEEFDTVIAGSVGSMADLSTVAEGIGKAMKAFPDSNPMTLLTALAAGQQVGATSMGQLIEAVPRVAPDLSIAGFNPIQMLSMMAAATTRMPDTDQAATAVADLVSSLALLTEMDAGFGAAKALGLPAGLKEMQAFMAQPGAVERIMTLSNQAFLNNPIQAKEVFRTKPAADLAKVSDAAMIETLRAARGKIDAQLADPSINAILANERAMTSGVLGEKIAIQGQLRDAQQAAGEVGVGAGLGIMEFFDKVGNDFVNTGADAQINGEMDAVRVIQQIGSVMKNLGFDITPEPREWKIMVEPSRDLNTTIGTTGDTGNSE